LLQERGRVVAGLGDSRPAPGHPENESYSRAAGADLAAAAEFLRSRGVRDVVAAGLCSGAHFGIFAALDRAPLAEVMAVNPQLYWRDGIEDRVDEAFQYSVLQQYGQSVRSWEKWRRLLAGRVSVARARHAARGLGRLIRRRIERRLLPAPLTPGEQLAGELRLLATSGPALFLVFSDRDGGFFQFNMHARPAVRYLERRRDFRLVLVEGADHNFMPIWCQRRLRTILTDRLRERYLQLP
jgi:hypothetical protein